MNTGETVNKISSFCSFACLFA